MEKRLMPSTSLACTTRMAAAVLLAAVSLTSQTARGDAPEFQPPRYHAWRTNEPIRIDGQLDELAWIAAPAVGDFHFPWFRDGNQEQSVVKILWDDEYLYIGAICQDAYITARQTEHDGPIYRDDCLEIMVAPDPTRLDHYYNIEWNAIGAYLDNHRPRGPANPSVPWDAEGVQLAGRIRGTPNDDSDRDECWITEIAIPLRNFAAAARHMPPRPGDMWRANLNRHGGETNMQYSQWSPGDTEKPSFHTPHRFGELHFSARGAPFTSP
jgi:hypothetical protein